MIFYKQDSDLLHGQSLGRIDTIPRCSRASTWLAVTQAARLPAWLAIDSAAKIIAESMPASASLAREGAGSSAGLAPMNRPHFAFDSPQFGDSKAIQSPETHPPQRQDNAA
jgi:hypothetical protein